MADMPARSTRVAMDDPQRSVREFLRRFREAGDQLDLDTIGASFAPEFLSLDQNGVKALGRDAMLVALPRRRALFDSIGATAAELVKVSELPLDERHTLVRTCWTMALAPRPEGWSRRNRIALHLPASKRGVVVADRRLSEPCGRGGLGRGTSRRRKRNLARLDGRLERPQALPLEGTLREHQRGQPRAHAVSHLRTIPSSCVAFVPAASRLCPRFPPRCSMVRRGSTVRVRQRALQKRWNYAFS
jgi:hypothetical protein